MGQEDVKFSFCFLHLLLNLNKHLYLISSFPIERTTSNYDMHEFVSNTATTYLLNLFLLNTDYNENHIKDIAEKRYFKVCDTICYGN